MSEARGAAKPLAVQGTNPTIMAQPASKSAAVEMLLQVNTKDWTAGPWGVCFTL